MAEENNGADAAQPTVRMQVLAQFIRDMSFENNVARKGISGSDVQPDIQVAVSLDARKRTAGANWGIFRPVWVRLCLKAAAMLALSQSTRVRRSRRSRTPAATGSVNAACSSSGLA